MSLENNTEPYTYLIGWTALNKWYYGVRYAKNCSPSDLWVIYKTSSKLVKEYYEKYGDPDVIQIRKTFNSSESAISWEENVLRRMNVLHKDMWLNQNISGAILIKKQSADHIKKRTQNKKHHPNQKKFAINALKIASEVNRGKTQSEETQRKKRETFYKNWDSKNYNSTRRNTWKKYCIEGEIYSGIQSVLDAFGITVSCAYYRFKSKNFNWEIL